MKWGEISSASQDGVSLLIITESSGHNTKINYLRTLQSKQKQADWGEESKKWPTLGGGDFPKLASLFSLMALTQIWAVVGSYGNKNKISKRNTVFLAVGPRKVISPSPWGGGRYCTGPKNSREEGTGEDDFWILYINSHMGSHLSYRWLGKTQISIAKTLRTEVKYKITPKLQNNPWVVYAWGQNENRIAKALRTEIQYKPLTNFQTDSSGTCMGQTQRSRVKSLKTDTGTTANRRWDRTYGLNLTGVLLC